MPLPDPNTAPDFAAGPTDTDQSITNRDVGLPKHYEGLLPGQRPYAWKCPGCGEGHFGRVEDGCKTCGAGADAKPGKPEVAVDPICRACRGNKVVSVKCKECDGTGGALIVGGVEICLECGGTGTLTIDCRRCRGTGFDPEPQAAQLHGLPEAIGTSEDFPLTHRSEYLGQPRDPLTGMARIMAEPQLPTLEDTVPHAESRAPRYFLMAVWPPSMVTAPTVVEIADSPKVRQIIFNSAKEIK